MADKNQLFFLAVLAIALLAIGLGGCSAINSPDDPVEPSGSGAGASSATSTTTTSGGCTTDCPDLPNATDECVAGACEYTCEAGFDDCDMDLGTAGGNGCEADVMSDPAHCGACPTMCAAADLCTNGMCHCEAAPGTAQFNATGTGNLGMLQSFQVPDCVVEITIEAFGAQGGAGTDTRGARMKGTFPVQPGQQLTILVGHQADQSQGLSGGGGTFVVDVSSNPLIIAGGGGSCFTNCPAAAETVGRVETSGGTAGMAPRADNGDGGAVINASSGGGGGFNGNGGNPHGGRAFLNGGAGGLGENFGGYGGGGARNGLFGQGGGGGYSGGSCGDLVSSWVGCGGGGSFNAGTDQDNSAGAQAGDGMVVITW